jgi:hypothetical protein
MFTIRYPSPSQILSYTVRAHRLRGAAVVSMIRGLARAAKLGR